VSQSHPTLPHSASPRRHATFAASKALTDRTAAVAASFVVAAELQAASPPEFQSDYSERLLLFPHSYFPSDLRESGGGGGGTLRGRALREERRRRGLPERGALLSGFNQASWPWGRDSCQERGYRLWRREELWICASRLSRGLPAGLNDPSQ
jgi:hypothetical protein